MVKFAMWGQLIRYMTNGTSQLKICWEKFSNNSKNPIKQM